MYNTLGDMNKKFFVAIYIRLSKEDDSLGDSESVNNQKTLLTNYVKEKKYEIYDTYIDDGFTGTNFNRPAFQRMLKDITDGKVNMVITKDLSRLSRDYIGTGEYVEKWFPSHNIRYVALTDNIDTFVETSNNDIAPFKAILNDMYAKDLSKKIRTALHTMQSDGKWVGGCTPYGYIIDPKNKHHLIVHEIEGPIITKIFNMAFEGKRINEIRNFLNDESVPTFTISRNRSLNRKSGEIYGIWTSVSVKKILKNVLYTGDLIQNKRSRISYKYRKIINNSSDKWIIVENTHEPLVDKNVFLKVQEMFPKNTQRNDKKEIFLLDGLIKCPDCGGNIAITARNNKTNKSYTVCNKYRKFRAKDALCTPHGNDYDKLESLVITKVKEVLKKVDYNSIEKDFENNVDLNDKTEDLAEKIIILKQDLIIKNQSIEKLYLDKLENKISEEFFEKIYNKIMEEINKLEEKINEYNGSEKESLEDKENIKDLNKLIEEFKNLDEVPRSLILKLINKIEIHENKNIDIYFNFKELNDY